MDIYFVLIVVGVIIISFLMAISKKFFAFIATISSIFVGGGLFYVIITSPHLMPVDRTLVYLICSMSIFFILLCGSFLYSEFRNKSSTKWR